MRLRALTLGFAVAATAALALATPSTAVASTATTPASVGAPAATATGPSIMATQRSIDCANAARSAGFGGDGLVTAVAVALAESGCNPGATGSNGPTSGCPNGSNDRGAWQINDCYHPEVDDACAYDLYCNASGAYAISSGGSNWQPWSTYNSGVYANYLGEAQEGVDATGGVAPSGGHG